MIRVRDANKLNTLIRKVSSVTGGGVELDYVEAVAEKRIQSKLVCILNVSHTPQKGRLQPKTHPPKCSTERHRRSLLIIVFLHYSLFSEIYLSIFLTIHRLNN